MTNRSISLFFALAFPMLTALAAVPPTKLTKDITWEITDDGILKVYGQGEIPDFKENSQKAWHQKAEKLKGLPNKWFKISAIEIGEGITSIGMHAFEPVYGDVLHDFNSNIIEIALPASLQSIGDNAFKNIKTTVLTLPDNLKVIRSHAFENGGPAKELVIPESVETIGMDAFSGGRFSTVTIHGNPVIGSGAFGSKSIQTITITGRPKASIAFTSPFPGLSPYTLYVHDSSLDLSDFMIGEKATVIYGTPSDDQNVKSYVANRTPSWEDFLAKKESEGKILSTDDAKADIEKKLTAWQSKGEFETTADWQKRVNETTRKKYLDGLIADRKKQINTVKKEYNNLRKKYADEFYDALAKREVSQILSDNFTLQQYDADNQTFLIQTSRNGDILLKVPRDKAQQFKKEWPNIIADKSIYITPHFAPSGENSVALQKIEFNAPGVDVFVYDGSAAQYAVTDINYNFAPLEIEDIDASSFSSPLVAETPASKTVGGSAITKRKVDVAHNTASVGNGGSAKPTVAKRSDVDTAIPKGNTQRPNTFALVIANENYRRVAPVPYALNDGAVVCEYLKTTLGLPEKNIIHVQDASLNDIKYNLQRLAEICRAYKGDASLIVYYAGHGVPDDKTKDAYLLPVDGYAESPSASGLSLASLTSALTELPTKSASLFLDACFSGGERAGAGGEMLVGARGVRIKPNKDAVSGKLVMFSATQGEETAHPYEEQQHGLFTYYLLKKLRESKGNVTLGDLTDYVTDNVERISAVNGKKQTPTVTASPENPSWRSSGL